MPLSLQGGLTFTVDGPAGSTCGEIVGDGPVLRVRADDPVVAWEASVGSVSTGPSALRGVADALAGEGLSIEVTGPRGRLALVGAGADSPVGRRLLGSRRVQLGSPAALRPLALAAVRRAMTPARTAGLAALIVVLAVLRRRARA